MTHPHQTPVRELYVSPDAATALQAEAEKLPAWMLDARQKGELALLMNGALAPLRGYMSEAEYSAVPDGAWPVRISHWPTDAFMQPHTGSSSTPTPAGSSR